MKISIDVMVNNDRTYYGTLKTDVPVKLKIGSDDQMYSVIPEEAIHEKILERWPTLKGRQYNVYFNDEK